jgi:hypothetical protein
MRSALIGVATIAAALVAGVQSGSAQESFFSERFCTWSTGDDERGANCAFHTWQQCIESARGSGRYCTENPFWRGPRGQPTAQAKSRRRNR